MEFDPNNKRIWTVICIVILEYTYCDKKLKQNILILYATSFQPSSSFFYVMAVVSIMYINIRCVVQICQPSNYDAFYCNCRFLCLKIMEQRICIKNLLKLSEVVKMLEKASGKDVVSASALWVYKVVQTISELS